MTATLARSTSFEAALLGAQEEARRLGHRLVGSEHLLLAVLAAPGAAATVLKALRLEWAAVRATIAELMPGSNRPTEGVLPLTESATAVIVKAEAVAKRLGATVVDTDHLLLGIAQQHEGIGSRVLTDYGATNEKIRNLVERETAERRTHACGQCGAALDATWRYCPFCGTALIAG